MLFRNLLPARAESSGWGGVARGGVEWQRHLSKAHASGRGLLLLALEQRSDLAEESC